MYERHWQLTQSPFRSACGPEYFCRLQSHAAALLKLKFVLEQRQASAALVGPSGIGKSLIIRMLEQSLPAGIGPLLHVNFPCLSPLELVRYLASELAELTQMTLPQADGLDQWLLAWERQLLQCRELGRLPVCIVDDAQAIDDRSIWQTWHLLLSQRERAGTGLSVLFVGQPELVGRLQRVPQLEERLALTCALTPLIQEEASDYITHRLAVAGRETPIFDESALRAIWEQSGGIPRRIDRLCDFSLLVGCAEGRTVITAAEIVGVAEEIQGRRAA